MHFTCTVVSQCVCVHCNRANFVAGAGEQLFLKGATHIKIDPNFRPASFCASQERVQAHHAQDPRLVVHRRPLLRWHARHVKHRCIGGAAFALNLVAIATSASLAVQKP